jgi:hypothetical protein
LIIRRMIWGGGVEGREGGEGGGEEYNDNI